jgi:hypothetical protein
MGLEVRVSLTVFWLSNFVARVGFLESQSFCYRLVTPQSRSLRTVSESYGQPGEKLFVVA